MSLSSLLVSRFFCRTVTDAHLPSGETWTSSARRVASNSSGVKGRAARRTARMRLDMGCALYHDLKSQARPLAPRHDKGRALGAAGRKRHMKAAGAAGVAGMLAGVLAAGAPLLVTA